MTASHTVEEMLEKLDMLTFGDEHKIWRERARSIRISDDALDLLDRAVPPVPYQYYFSTPELLVDHPRLVFYYRNIAMLSNRGMCQIDLDCAHYESGEAVPGPIEASEMAAYFNGIVSAILLSYDKVLPKQHILMFLANLNSE